MWDDVDQAKVCSNSRSTPESGEGIAVSPAPTGILPGLPFVDDSHILLNEGGDAIEAVGHNKGEGMWGRVDEDTADSGWRAFMGAQGNCATPWGVRRGMDHDLVTAAFGAAGALVVALSSQVVTEGLTRRREARAQRAADRAELQAQADELLAAVIALRAAGGMNDQLAGGLRPRLTAILHALAQGAAVAAGPGQPFHRGLTGVGRVSEVVSQWDRESAVSAAGLVVPLSRLGAAVAPLMRNPDQALAGAAGKVLDTVVANYKDDEGTGRALAAFRTELVRVLEAPTPRRRLLWRRGSSS
ncbi:hypothetical protein ABT404_48995 [Streptomyces hyaluromycini]|uniref:Uncharacterized protein n=1 Tax=Streptomyces hyaluromycini TaxID=1377993 RepID=A0ABV1XE77_9ACTN